MDEQPRHLRQVCKRLTKLQADNDSFRSVVFEGRGDWVVLTEGNGYSTSQARLPVCEKLAELHENKDTAFKAIAMSASSDAWTIFWNHGYLASNAPGGSFEKMQEVVKSGGTLRSVSFGPRGEWVVLFGKTGIWCGDIPPSLGKVFENAIKNDLTVHCVCFTTGGTWICLTNHGSWTNNPNHPACKMIAELEKQHEDLRWVAVAPSNGPHDFQKWADYIHEQCANHLPGGYAFLVFQKGRLVASEAEGWARAPFQPGSSSVKWTFGKPMGVASLSKTVTAVALLKLWEETGQKFSLDDPFWPKIRAICPQASASVKKVTIRQLLQHKSGFKKEPDYNSPQDMEKLLTLPLEYPPGTHYAYHNNNFYLARLVLEQIGHVQYTPYVKQHVLEPMGISRMEMHFQAGAPMCGYGKPGTTRPGFPFDWNMEAKGGAAGWYASANDMGRFLLGLRNHKVLGPATTDMMYSDMLGWDNSEPGYEKSGGWLWDEGSGPGSRAGDFYCSMSHFPDDVDAVMFMNYDPPVRPTDLLARAWSLSRED